MDRQITRPPSVRIAFRTFWRTLRHSYENLFSLGTASMLWLVCMLPVVPLIVLVALATGLGSTFLLVIGLLLVGFGPPSAALHRITQRMSEERASRWNTFWQDLRADAGWSARLAGTLLFGLFLAEINRGFYSRSLNTTFALLSGFFLVIILVWLGIMFCAIPMALRQDEQSLRITLRNASVLVLANLPGMIVSFLLLFFSSLLLVIIPPLFLFVPGWIALWSEENVRLLLVAAGHIPPDEFADR